MSRKFVIPNAKPLPLSDGDMQTFIPIWLWTGVTLALVARLAVAWSPVETSFALSVPDDAYYYFTIARNWAAGAGISFDGLAPTNGFHPLWLVVITPLWYIHSTSQALPVHLALTMGALLDLMTMGGIWYLAYLLTERPMIAGFTVLVYAWNPYTLATSVNGLETSLGAMIFVWSLVVYWRLRLIDHIRLTDSLLIGSLWSLLILARTDYLIIIAFCALDLIWRQRARLRRIWPISAGAVLLTPWLIWNWLNFGSISQVSGKAYPYYLRTIWQAEEHTFQELVVQELRMGYGIFANLSRLSGFGKLIVPLALVVVVLLVISRLGITHHELRNWSRISGLVWPTLGGVSLLLIHGLIRWMYVPWYFIPVSVMVILWFGVMLAWLRDYHKVLTKAVGILILALQLVQGAIVLRQGGMWPEQGKVVREATPIFHKDCERYQMIGISDAGYWGYYLPCRVVNLDGVVNNQAFEAIRRGQFRRYLDEIGVEKVYLNEIVSSVVALREGNVPMTPPFSEGR